MSEADAERVVYTPKTIAVELGISRRHAQRLCGRLFGYRSRYVLDQADRDRVAAYYDKTKLNAGLSISSAK